MRAVALYVSGEGEMPRMLGNAIRMRRYGAPWPGGWMTWPARWVADVETADGAYTALTEVNRAMTQLDGDRLADWKTNNAHLVKHALEIEALLEPNEAANNG